MYSGGGKKRLTKHAAVRNRQRFGTSNKRIKEVLTYGYTVDEFVGPFHDYLAMIKTKTGGAGNVKVRDNMLVVYNKRSQRAITVWEVPEKYIPVENFLRQTVVKVGDELWKYIGGK